MEGNAVQEVCDGKEEQAVNEELLLVDEAGIADTGEDEAGQDTDGVALLTAEAAAVEVATHKDAEEDDGEAFDQDAPGGRGIALGYPMDEVDQGGVNKGEEPQTS